MTIATDMHAPLLCLTLAHQRLSKRPDNADLCAQLLAALEHLEDLRQAVQALEELAARMQRGVTLPAHYLPQREPSLAELDTCRVISLEEAKRVRAGVVR